MGDRNASLGRGLGDRAGDDRVGLALVLAVIHVARGVACGLGVGYRAGRLRGDRARCARRRRSCSASGIRSDGCGAHESAGMDRGQHPPGRGSGAVVGPNGVRAGGRHRAQRRDRAVRQSLALLRGVRVCGCDRGAVRCAPDRIRSPVSADRSTRRGRCWLHRHRLRRDPAVGATGHGHQHHTTHRCGRDRDREHPPGGGGTDTGRDHDIEPSTLWVSGRSRRRGTGVHRGGHRLTHGRPSAIAQGRTLVAHMLDYDTACVCGRNTPRTCRC